MLPDARVLKPHNCAFPIGFRCAAGIVAAPAVLESTAHVLVHGLDLFYTRVQPSAAFDLLAEDFPSALLLILVAAMTAGAAALRHVADKSTVKAKWQ